MRVEPGVAAHRDGDLGELLGGGAELVHVALRDQRVGVQHRRRRTAPRTGRAGRRRRGRRCRSRSDRTPPCCRRRSAPPRTGRRRSPPRRAATWATNDEPPMLVPSRKRGFRLRCSASDMMPIGPTPAVRKPSTSPIVSPASCERPARALGADLELRLVRRPARRVLVDAGDHRPRQRAHRGSTRRRTRSSAALNAAGCSLVSMWPASSMTASCAPGMRRCSSSALLGRREVVVAAGDDQRRQPQGAEARREVDAVARQHVGVAHARVGLHLLHEALAHHRHVDLGREQRRRERLRGAAAHDVAPGVEAGLRHVEARRRRDQHQRAQRAAGVRARRRSPPRRRGRGRRARTDAARSASANAADAAHVRVEIGQPLGAAGTPVTGKIERQRRVLRPRGASSC